MRRVGSLLSFCGLVLAIVGVFMGAGSLFTWNGRHVFQIEALTPGTPRTVSLSPEAGRHYTVAVHVVFDRPGAEPPATASVSAKLPLVARVVDPSGQTVGQTVGWIDPEEPPTVLLGSHPSPRQAERTELVAERLVGSFPATAAAPYSVHVDLGPDRTGRARILETRVVVYDDVMPAAIKRAFAAAAVGAAAFFVGLAVLVLGFFRRPARRGGKRGR